MNDVMRDEYIGPAAGQVSFDRIQHDKPADYDGP